jgi:hypothetical protein
VAAPLTIAINRAPVMTLWASVVAERLGFRKDEALSLGRAVAGLNAQAKGRRIGVFQPDEEKPEAARARKGTFPIEVCGRLVPARNTADGIRAVQRETPIDPEGVAEYLEGKFDDYLKEVRAAMLRVARSYPKDELAAQAYALYERFRPGVRDGKSGWGAKGTLDVAAIARLRKTKDD